VNLQFRGGTKIGKRGPVLAAKIGPGGPILVADRFFRYSTAVNCINDLFYPIVVTCIFDQSLYDVDEDDGQVQPIIVCDNPSSTDITFEVTNTDGSATGEY